MATSTETTAAVVVCRYCGQAVMAEPVNAMREPSHVCEGLRRAFRIARMADRLCS